MRNPRRWPIAMLMGIVVSTSAAAQGRPTGAAGNPAAVTVVADNITAREAAAAGHPRAAADSGRLLTGDLIEYRLLFTNTTRGPLRDVVLDDPLPAGLVYELGSAAAAAPGVTIEFSIDGGRTYTTNPVVKEVVNGQEIERAAPAALYTHIRWRLTGALSPGARVTASFRARLAAADRQ